MAKRNKYCGLVIDDWCYEVEDVPTLFEMLIQAESKTHKSKLRGSYDKTAD